ncbi:putative DNA-directed RNA polymerase III subunit [Leptomonas pyrrhocoris]|uniref:Putative DNA-directed RNA polymerase III subunit n=1 Tax=Leptomonas pyrrhocoris TaxID=157538 RepID=A0A0N0VE79_LEPPY|nr:putative DNA-directed RNA polymerase III subunit [Leptomonas pyrrhocoris]XP_015656083.1 putative DNA-directed RNA polymerase III subunit [Leptomonas pyrrhocoris]XP_015656084.1 putative DNA-directed RNA polymerase III subunit [Leptomonas pyrrhocoris]KPA77643.1 putative DNA-directed RNA polymerase III subunit [Leptomonas pyrrhocoris]KPA77644.1 putative DNA-directed RNA polymerase III subunit [Leptomonas pyrrhocoris]KPA77645.1 putative DNA-directed RNA polymerase III subunit [Leptomonas pyrrho|eukprot:XP_015656082.1 putative DNA-directed RNA polymerase III subunit [Leptomonas pyrrhocoris]
MFASYVLYDTVAIEAVYFPHNFAAAASSGADASHAVRANNAEDNSLHHSIHRHSGGDGDGDDNDEPYALTLRDVVLHRLTERYVGRVVPSRGLCVAITDVMEYSASCVRGAAASAWLTATFGVCVFAPTPGTRMRARIAHQSAAGVFLTLDLFVSVPFLVPAAVLVPGSRYHAAQRCWYLPLDSGSCGSSGDKNGLVSSIDGADPFSRQNGDISEMGGELSCTAAAGAVRSATSAMAPPSAPHNKYMVGAEVIVKVVSCTVLSEEAVAAAAEEAAAETEMECNGGGSASVRSLSTLPSSAGAGAEFGGTWTDGPPPIMELRGSFVGDALGPIAWFDDA